jgi:hypothetical protein
MAVSTRQSARIALAFLILPLAACHDSSPTAPALSSLTGSWSGSISFEGCNAGSLSVEISEFEYQGSRFLDGQWSGACGNSGHATGSVQGNDVNIDLGVGLTNCVLVAIGSRRGENGIDAHFERSRCASSGSLQLARPG